MLHRRDRSLLNPRFLFHRDDVRLRLRFYTALGCSFFLRTHDESNRFRLKVGSIASFILVILIMLLLLSFLGRLDRVALSLQFSLRQFHILLFHRQSLGLLHVICTRLLFFHVRRLNLFVRDGLSQRSFVQHESKFPSRDFWVLPKRVIFPSFLKYHPFEDVSRKFEMRGGVKRTRLCAFHVWKRRQKAHSSTGVRFRLSCC